MQPDTREPTLLSKRIDGWIQQIAEGRIRDACKEIESVLKDCEEPSAAGVINDLGNHFWDQKNDDVAIELLNRASQLAEHSGRVALQARVLGTLGDLYYAKESYDRALPHFERAATLYAKCGDSTWFLMMRISVGNALDELTQTENACAQYLATAELAKSLGVLPPQALALGNLGNVFGKRGEFREARAYHAQALELAWQAEEPALVGNLARDLSNDLRSLADPGATDAGTIATKALHAWTEGRRSLARAGLHAAILLLDEASNPMQLADYLDCAAQFDLAASALTAATDEARRAVALARKHGDDRPTAGFLLNLSAIHLAAGELGDALDTANESFTLAKKSNNGAAAVRALGNLGIVSQKQGQFSRAENYLRRQHDLALETKDGPQAASAANALGALFLELGSHEQSAALLNEARQLADQHGLANLAVSCLINLAILEGRKRDGDRDAQEAMYRRAIALSIEIDNADTHVDAAINLVRLLLAKGDADEAIRLLGATEDLAEQLGDPQKRAALTMLRAEAALNQGRLDDAREEFDAAGAAFSEISPAQSADCYVEAASIEYRQLLEEEPSSPKPLEPGDRDLLLEQIFRKLVLPLSTYEGIARRLEDSRLWSLMQRQEKGFRLYADVCLKLFGPRSALAVVERSRARALRFAMYRRLAGHRTSAFHYAQAIRDQVFQVVTDLPSSTSNFAALTPDTFEALTRSVDRKDPQVQYYLSEEQLDQVVRSVGATVVEFAFSTQGSLHVWVMNGGTVHFVELNLDAVGGVAGLRDTISQLRVSIGLTRDLGAGLARPGTESRALLERLYSLLVHPIESWLPEKVGDPICLVPDGPLYEVPFAALQTADGRAVLDRWAVFELPAIHFLAVSPEEPGTGFVVVGDATTPPAAEKEFGPITRLPFARDEALEVAHLYGVTALIDSNATKDKVDPAWESAELVHIATHAILSPTRPFDSAIVLAAPPEGDAFIRVRDIDTKTLQSRLVVLSCCSTGGGVVTGDGVLSLCRGLLAAGAHSVIASLWAVSDESTRFTMIDFHQRLAENPFQNTLAGMFRESLLATRAKYPHHSQWAPFVLWGWPHWVQGRNWAHRDHAILGKPAPP